MNRPPISIESAALECAALNLFSYLNFKARENSSLEYIVKNAKGNKDILKLLNLYLKTHPHFGKLKLVKQSRDIENTMLMIKYNPDAFNAYTLKVPGENRYFIVYRGTAKGGWIQNGVAFGPAQENTYFIYERDLYGNVIIKGEKIVREYLSTVQSYAINYFNYNAVKFNWDVNSDITVTGHSQGGCNAKLITLTSPLVRACYDFNSPNFSKEAIYQFKNNKFLYEKQRKKISIFRTEDDQVSIFGCEVVDDNQIYYLKGKFLGNNHEIHKMLSIIHDEDGNQKMAFNDYVQGRNFWVNILKEYNNILIELPPDIRGTIAKGIMWFPQKFRGKESVFNERVNLWNICLAVLTSGIIIPRATILALGKKYGITIQYMATLLMGLAVLYFAPIIIGVFGIITFIGLIDYIIFKFRENKSYFGDTTKKLIELFSKIKIQLQKFYK